jgi:hypothetical protein
MPLDDRYTHWQQHADDPILDYAPLELRQDVESMDAPEPAVLTDLTEDAALHLQQAMHAQYGRREEDI